MRLRAFPAIAGGEVAPRGRRFVSPRLLREPAAAAPNEHRASFRFVRIRDTGRRGESNRTCASIYISAKYVYNNASNRGATKERVNSAANPLPTGKKPRP